MECGIQRKPNKSYWRTLLFYNDCIVCGEISREEFLTGGSLFLLVPPSTLFSMFYFLLFFRFLASFGCILTERSLLIHHIVVRDNCLLIYWFANFEVHLNRSGIRFSIWTCHGVTHCLRLSACSWMDFRAIHFVLYSFEPYYSVRNLNGSERGVYWNTYIQRSHRLIYLPFLTPPFSYKFSVRWVDLCPSPSDWLSPFWISNAFLSSPLHHTASGCFHIISHTRYILPWFYGKPNTTAVYE